MGRKNDDRDMIVEGLHSTNCFQSLAVGQTKVEQHIIRSMGAQVLQSMEAGAQDFFMKLTVESRVLARAIVRACKKVQR